ncbi:MAG: hypothetical protein R3E83_25345 [Burkholderiaceae bacterium]
MSWLALTVAGACGMAADPDSARPGTSDSKAVILDIPATHLGTLSGSMVIPGGSEPAEFELAVGLYPGGIRQAGAGASEPHYWLLPVRPAERLSLILPGSRDASRTLSTLLPSWQISLPIWIENGAARSLDGIGLSGTLDQVSVALNITGLNIGGIAMGPLRVVARSAD